MIDLPIEFTEKFTGLLGNDEANKLFNALQEPTKKAFRLNPLKSGYKEVKQDLTEKLALIKDAYVGQIDGHSIEQLAGYVYSQDPAAMFVAEAAAVHPGERVLDLCAAPGGKTTQLASGLHQQGVLVANEINQSRAKTLLENVERWGIQNSLVLNESPARLVPYFTGFFDKIVVDAPCSGEGMFRKDPVAVKYWSPDYVATCQIRQQEIVSSAYAMLRPGGRLIYSTCTFSPEENEQIVEYLLGQFSDMKLVPIQTRAEFDPGHPEWGTTGNAELRYTARFWPQRNFGEGQFVAILEKSSAVAVNESHVAAQLMAFDSRKNVFDQDAIREFFAKIKQTDLLSGKRQPTISNNHVFLPIINPAAIKGLRILRNGLELGELKKKRFLPHHQLVQILDPDSVPFIKLNSDEEFRKFVHGETIKVESPLRGFLPVAYQHKIFSWGKLGNDGILKNFYPKGLRR